MALVQRTRWVYFTLSLLVLLLGGACASKKIDYLVTKDLLQCYTVNKVEYYQETFLGIPVSWKLKHYVVLSSGKKYEVEPAFLFKGNLLGIDYWAYCPDVELVFSKDK